MKKIIIRISFTQSPANRSRHLTLMAAIILKKKDQIPDIIYLLINEYNTIYSFDKGIKS